MIDVIGYIQQEVCFDNTYIDSVKTVNITTNFMDDHFVPYRESAGCMIWLNEQGLLGELECIFPVENLGGTIKSDVAQLEIINGVPLLKVSHSEYAVQYSVVEDNLIVYFDAELQPDKKYITPSTVFYANAEKLVAIECIGIQKI